MAVANAIQLTKLGIKNRDKLIKTGQYTDGPQAKNWQTCDGSMDWRTTVSLKPRKDKNGMLYYSYYNALLQTEMMLVYFVGQLILLMELILSQKETPFEFFSKHWIEAEAPSAKRIILVC